MIRLFQFAALSLYFTCLAVPAQQGGDLEAQILYAFHTEDSNRLQSMVQTLATQEQAGADNTLRYHLAHATYRLGLLQQASGAHAAAAYAECIEQLKAILEQDANSAESLGLQSACYAHLASLRKFEAMLLRAQAASRMQHALALAPRNPRILLLAAENGLAHAAAGAARAQAFEQLQLAVHLFEQTSATSVDTPGWGHAESYLDLGRQLHARGDVLDARNWIEKALLVAPDYKAAQRELKSLALR